MNKFAERIARAIESLRNAQPKRLIEEAIKMNTVPISRILGVHITPIHYYSPIPDVNALRDEVFEKTHTCRGMEWNAAEQQRYVHEVFPAYKSEYVAPLIRSYDCFYLYSMLRHKKPRVVVEVGAGGSTQVSLAALERNRQEGHEFQLHSIDPFPRKDAMELQNPRFTLIKQPVQNVEVDFICKADLVFVDSSHVVKTAGDVNYLFFDVMPQLKMGATIHLHDIFLPNEYPRNWLQGGYFFNEAYLLQAFLMFNQAFKVIWAAQYMHTQYADDIRRELATLKFEDDVNDKVSFWIERCG